MGEGALLAAAARVMNASRGGRTGGFLAFGPELAELDWSAPGAGKVGAYLVDVPSQAVDLAAARALVLAAVAAGPTTSIASVREGPGGAYLWLGRDSILELWHHPSYPELREPVWRQVSTTAGMRTVTARLGLAEALERAPEQAGWIVEHTRATASALRALGTTDAAAAAAALEAQLGTVRT